MLLQHDQRPTPQKYVLTLKEVTRVYNKPLRFVFRVVLILSVPSRHSHPFTPVRIPFRDFALVAAADLRVELRRVRNLGNIQATLRKKKKDAMSRSALLLFRAWCVYWVRCAACDG